MTHTSTEQPEALRLADDLDSTSPQCKTWQISSELRRLHARVQELEVKVEIGKRLLREEMERANRYAEASQARVPLDYYTVSMAHLQIGAAGMLEATERIVRWTERAHGITQEKQG